MLGEAKRTDKKDRFLAFLERLGLHRKDQVSLMEATEVKQSSFSYGESDVNHAGILDTFISKVTCYDHRIHQRRLRFMGPQPSRTTIDECDNSDWADTDSDNSEEEQPAEGNDLNSRDVLYAILSCLDPFLLQDVLTKMTACQLAIPVLMPNVLHHCVEFRLWCLRKIIKSWYDNETATIQTENVASYKLLTVAALKFGEVHQSKSNVLNKMFGISQGNDEHAYFNCSEQDPSPSFWSKGTVECVWYLPEIAGQSKQTLGATSASVKSKLTDVLTVLNLRGDAQEYEAQSKFAIKLSFVTIVFMDSKDKKKYKDKVNEIKETSHVILILCPSEHSEKTRGQKPKKFLSLTIIDSTGLAAIGIADLISERIAQLIEANKDNLKRRSLEQSTGLCRELSISIDEEIPECKESRENAEKITALLESNNYMKEKIFPVQTCWKRVMRECPHDDQSNSDIENDVDSDSDSDIEEQLAEANQKEMNLRKT